MKRLIKKGSTDQTIIIFIQDSASTTGAGKTGIAYNTSGLTCYYVRPGAAASQLSLATQTVTGSHSDGGFVEIDSTNLPGFYRLDLSDAIIATGVDGVVLGLRGASGMAQCNIEIQLEDANSGELTTSERSSVADSVLDEAVESTVTLRQMVRLFASSLTGKMTVTDNGDGTHTYTFRDIGDTKDRIVIISNDTTKNRTSVTTRDGS